MRRHHRRQREADEQRHRDRERHRQAEARHEAADDAAHEADRQKMAISDSVVARTARPISCVAVDRGLHRRHALLLDEAVDVLEHDDRVVDDDTDRERQREQRDHVEREAHVPDQREGAR